MKEHPGLRNSKGHPYCSCPLCSLFEELWLTFDIPIYIVAFVDCYLVRTRKGWDCNFEESVRVCEKCRHDMKFSRAFFYYEESCLPYIGRSKTGTIIQFGKIFFISERHLLARYTFSNDFQCLQTEANHPVFRVCRSVCRPIVSRIWHNSSIGSLIVGHCNNGSLNWSLILMKWYIFS